MENRDNIGSPNTPEWWKQVERISSRNNPSQMSTAYPPPSSEVFYIRVRNVLPQVEFHAPLLRPRPISRPTSYRTQAGDVKIGNLRAVIDERAFVKHRLFVNHASGKVIHGGKQMLRLAGTSNLYLVQVDDPKHRLLGEEILGHRNRLRLRRQSMERCIGRS